MKKPYKRIGALLLALALSFSMCACGGNTGNTGNTGTNSNEIALTLDNYEQYLKVGARAELKNEYKSSDLFILGISSDGYKFGTSDFSQNVYGYIWAEGLSQNFNYNNIKIEVEVTVKCCHFDYTADSDNMMETAVWEEFDFIAVCNKLAITGNGNNRDYLSDSKYALPTGRGVPCFDDWYPNVTMNYKQSSFIEYECKVVAISGTVSPA